MNRSITLGALTLAIVTSLAACGGGEDPKVGENPAANNDGNNATNNGSTNAATNAATNGEPNNAPSNNGTNADPNNAPTNNQTTPNNTVDPRGDASFVLPVERTVFTNATAFFEVAVEGDAQDVELVLDTGESIAALGDTTAADWDTTDRAEGSYEVDIRFSLGDAEPRWADDPRTIVVDRTAPAMVAQTPTARSSDARPSDPISVTFDEPLDPATVSDTTVELTLDGVVVPHTVTLGADQQTIQIDFDRATYAPPYTVGVAMKGAADLAGNLATDSYSYAVAAWRTETFSGALGETQFFVLGGAEYVLGVVQGSPDDLLRVYKNDGAGNWSQVAQQALGVAHDIDATQLGDQLHIAVLRNDVISGTSVKAAQLYTFDPARNALTAGERVGVGMQSNSGEIAIHVRSIVNATTGAIAVADAGALRVYKFSNGLLSQSTNSFPTADYANVRDTDLSVWVSSFGYPDVVFATCSTANTPCTRTRLRRVSQSGSGWTAAATTIGTPISVPAANCDQYVNFDVIRDAMNVPTAAFAEYAPCDTPEPFVKTAVGAADDWTTATLDFFATMPGADTAKYEVRQAFDANRERLVLLAAPTRLMLARVGQGAPVWLAQPAPDIQPSGSPTDRFRAARVALGADGSPVVVFRYNNVMHVLRAN